MDLRNSLNLLQNVTNPTWTNDTSITLIEVALPTNKSFIADYNVNILAVANHCLVAVTLELKAPKPWPSYIFTRSYKNHNPESFLSNLEWVPFYIVNIFNNFDDQVDVINKLFLYTLSEHVQIKRIQIK